MPALNASGIATATPADRIAPAAAADPRAIHATIQPVRFLALAVQLAVLLFVMNLYHTMERPEYLRLTAVAFAAFLVHYWIPIRFKEWFWVAVSIGGSFYLLPSRVAELLLATGLGFFLIFRASLPFRFRMLLIGSVFAVLMGCYIVEAPHIPSRFYPVFGAIFMFRTVAYAYDLVKTKERARLLPFLSYFFILPNYLFMLFPVIDYRTMRRTWYQRDIHDIAQQGVFWMTRGVIQLTLYRGVTYLNDYFFLDRINSPGALASAMILTFLLYLNVSGQFHFIVGMLHLFGYDLPETNRRYLLSSSIMDFWRRINIYWKDFMVKLVYFPAYFRLRKKGDLRAQLIATAAVIAVTWLGHHWQYFWIRGHFNFSWADTVFWGILGLLMMIDVVVINRSKRKVAAEGWQPALSHALKVVGTFMLIVTLWSLWSSSSVDSWLQELAWWQRAA